MTSDPGFLPFLSSVEKRKGVNWQITGILTCPVFLFVLSFYVLHIVFSLKDRADSESLTYFSTKQGLIREGVKKNRIYLGLCPKLWVGGSKGGSKVPNFLVKITIQ